MHKSIKETELSTHSKMILKLLFILFFVYLNLNFINSSNVELLKESNFSKKVNKSSKLNVVKFYPSDCSGCFNDDFDLQHLATAFDQGFNFFAVESGLIASEQDINVFPSYKLFNKGKQILYDGVNDVKAVAQFLLDAYTDTVMDLINHPESVVIEKKKKTREREEKKKHTHDSDKKKSHKESSGNKNHQNKKYIDEFNDTSLQKFLDTDTDPWIMLFYAPWCGHCKAIMPVWETLRKQSGSSFKVGKIDASTNTKAASLFQIKGFPTIFYFPQGKKDVHSAVLYEGERKLDSILNFIKSRKPKSVNVDKIASVNEISSHCSNTLCFISLLPPLIDSSTQEIDGYRQTLQKSLSNFSNYPMKGFWIEGGTDLEWENKHQLNFGYPALMAIHIKKQKYAIYQGAYETNGIQAFINKAMHGKIYLYDIPVELHQVNNNETLTPKNNPDENVSHDL